VLITGRRLKSLGHDARLMAPQFVKPYVKSNKNDVADAEAICEAVGRPNMRFVPAKSVEQQAVLSLHRVRQGFVKARTAQANQIRGLLGEFGLIMPAGISHIAKRVPSLLEDASNQLPGSLRLLITRLTEHLEDLHTLVGEFEAKIKAWHRSSELSMKLEKIPGIGPLGASALVASIADANSFDNGRQLSAWLGLVPRQHSSGGKPTPLGISRRGDGYLRTLLIHGARSPVPGDGVALDVADTALVLALGPGSERSTRPRHYSPVVAEGVQALVEDDFAGLHVVLADQSLCVVDQQLARRAAEVPEGALEALQPGRLALVQEQRDVGAARVAQGGHEQMDLDHLAGHRHAHAAEVDLQLMSGRHLEAHRCQRLGEQLSAQVRHRPFNGAQVNGNAVLALQILAHNVGVATVLQKALGEPHVDAVQS
jgi:transposase